MYSDRLHKKALPPPRIAVGPGPSGLLLPPAVPGRRTAECEG